MSPLELETDEVVSFVLQALPAPPATVLEVGCGDGRLAERLTWLGFDVTGIDADPEAIAAARQRGVNAVHASFLAFDARPFDALLFTRSLHHISPLSEAVARARALLAPHGTLVIDELAHDEVDRFTAAWFFDVQAALEAAGALRPDAPRHHHHHHHRHDHHHHATPSPDPLERWREYTTHEPPLHGAKAMVDALASTFTLSRTERLPYLHRYFVDRLPADEAGMRIFAELRRMEDERVAQGILVRVGLRLTGTSAADSRRVVT